MFFISQLSKFLEGTAYSTSVTNDSHAYYCLLIDLAFPSLHVERLGVSTFRTLHVRGRRVTRNIALLQLAMLMIWLEGCLILLALKLSC